MEIDRITAARAAGGELVSLSGTGTDIYTLAAAKIFACDVKEIGKKDPRRRAVKAAALFTGFGGGRDGN